MYKLKDKATTFIKQNLLYIFMFLIYVFFFFFFGNGVGLNFDTKGANTITTFINVGNIRKILKFQNWQQFAICQGMFYNFSVYLVFRVARGFNYNVRF